MADYRKLVVWKKAHSLTLEMFAFSAILSRERQWELRSQLLRAAISIPSNIAEGSGRGSDPDFRRFLRHSLGSTNELEYDLLLARDLGFLPAGDFDKQAATIAEVRRMLSGLIERLTNDATTEAES
jgi:four helix bundle protein